jgi:heptosyltransferase-2
MKWRRFVESVSIAAATAIQVVVCRVLYGHKVRPLTDEHAQTGPVLVIRCEAKIGDNLLNIPFLRALRLLYPEREIHLLHHSAARGVYLRCPYVDERIEIEWPMSSPLTLLRRLSLTAAVFRRRPAHVRYALALVPRWDEDLFAPFLGWMSGAPRVIGFSRRVLSEKAWRNLGTDLLYTDAVCDRSVQHESTRSLQLLERLPNAKRPVSAKLEFWYSEEDVEKVKSLMRRAAPSAFTVWIALTPGAAIDRRKWPIDRFATVARALARWPGVALVILGTSTDAADCAAVEQACHAGASVNLAGQLDLSQTAAALSLCKLFIGNDSGVLHMAGAVGTPVLEISCHPILASELHANSPARFGPTVHPSRVLRPPRPLTAECSNGCVYDSAHCITTVTVDSVVREAAAVLGLGPDGHGVDSPALIHQVHAS